MPQTLPARKPRSVRARTCQERDVKSATKTTGRKTPSVSTPVKIAARANAQQKTPQRKRGRRGNGPRRQERRKARAQRDSPTPPTPAWHDPMPALDVNAWATRQLVHELHTLVKAQTDALMKLTAAVQGLSNCMHSKHRGQRSKDQRGSSTQGGIRKPDAGGEEQYAKDLTAKLDEIVKARESGQYDPVPDPEGTLHGIKQQHVDEYHEDTDELKRNIPTLVKQVMLDRKQHAMIPSLSHQECESAHKLVMRYNKAGHHSTGETMGMKMYYSDGSQEPYVYQVIVEPGRFWTTNTEKRVEKKPSPNITNFNTHNGVKNIIRQATITPVESAQALLL